jgi:hypothetical protein
MSLADLFSAVEPVPRVPGAAGAVEAAQGVGTGGEQGAGAILGGVGSPVTSTDAADRSAQIRAAQSQKGFC